MIDEELLPPLKPAKRAAKSKAAKLRPTIIDFVENAEHYGDLFRSASWDKWKTILRACYGLPLKPSEVEFFRTVTGRTAYAPPPGGFREIIVLTGTRSGKSSIAAAIADYEAAFPINLPRIGDAYVMLVAQDQRSALRTLLNYARAPFETSETLKALVNAETADVLSLTTGVKLAAYPCRPAAVRGITAVTCIADELAFFISTEGNPVDLEMLRALRSRTATTGGKVIVLSSPYAEAGALYDVHRQHYGRDDSTTLVIQCDAPTLNPNLPADYLQKMEQDDPEAYRSEVLGLFRAGLSTLLDPKALDACVDFSIREKLPQDGVRYTAFTDAATGGGSDKFTVAIGHTETMGGRRINVLDLVRGWVPPFDPNVVIAEIADLVKTYRVKTVTGDRFAGGAEGGFVQSGFEANGMQYKVSDLDRSAIYLELVPLVNSNTCFLIHNREMLRELRSLERRRGLAGKDRVDHRRGGHDDLANSAAGCLVLLAAVKTWDPSLSVVSSVTRSTDGTITVRDSKRGTEVIQQAHNARAMRNHPSVHPYEREVAPFQTEAEVRMGQAQARKWRSAWGGS